MEYPLCMLINEGNLSFLLLLFPVCIYSVISMHQKYWCVQAMDAHIAQNKFVKLWELKIKPKQERKRNKNKTVSRRGQQKCPMPRHNKCKTNVKKGIKTKTFTEEEAEKKWKENVFLFSLLIFKDKHWNRTKKICYHVCITCILSEKRRNQFYWE